MKAVTEKQQELLDYVQMFHAEHAMSPTIHEIMCKFGWKSEHQVTAKLKALERKGKIRRKKGKARGIVLISENKYGFAQE